MKLSPTDHARLDRLASEVGGGGGLALPSLFSALLTYLLDNGPADTARMVQIVETECAAKTKRLAESWQGSWGFLTQDALDQLASRGYVSITADERWELGENFTAGVLLETVPERKRRNSASFTTVYEKAEREARTHQSWVQGRLAQFIEQPRGKSHDKAIIDKLRTSAEQSGFRNPILRNNVGEIIDGRHRYDIDPTWPSEKLDINPGWDTLRAIQILDEWRSREKLGKTAADNLAKFIQDEAPARDNATKRERIEAALREDASRSNRAIADLIGVDDKTVGSVRSELQETAEIPQFSAKGGRGNRTGQQADPERPREGKQGDPPHPPYTETEFHEYCRLRNEGVAKTKAEALIRGLDKPRASLTTEGMKAETRYQDLRKQADAAEQERQLDWQDNTIRNFEEIWHHPERHAEELLEDEILAQQVYQILRSHFILKAIELNADTM